MPGCVPPDGARGHKASAGTSQLHPEDSPQQQPGEDDQLSLSSLLDRTSWLPVSTTRYLWHTSPHGWQLEERYSAPACYLHIHTQADTALGPDFGHLPSEHGVDTAVLEGRSKKHD